MSEPQQNIKFHALKSCDCNLCKCGKCKLEFARCLSSIIAHYKKIKDLKDLLNNTTLTTAINRIKREIAAENKDIKQNTSKINALNLNKHMECMHPTENNCIDKVRLLSAQFYSEMYDEDLGIGFIENLYKSFHCECPCGICTCEECRQHLTNLEAQKRALESDTNTPKRLIKQLEDEIAYMNTNPSCPHNTRIMPISDD